MTTKSTWREPDGWKGGTWRRGRLAQAEVEEGGWYYGRTWLTAKHIKEAERRWAERAYVGAPVEESGYLPYQCGGCKFFAAYGADYGVCWNVRSPRDGMIMFEHGGCGEHSDIKGERQE